ncbi:unnamed protein product [Rhodiola kirilowii]
MPPPVMGGDQEEGLTTPIVKEHNYMGLSDCSSVDSSAVCIISPRSDVKLNLKATELRLGLPGSQSPERDVEPHLLTTKLFNEKPIFSFHPSNNLQKIAVFGTKRGFSDAMNGLKEGKFLDSTSADLNGILSTRSSPNMGMNSGLKKENIVASASKMKEIAPSDTIEGRSYAINETTSNVHRNAGATKVQVVGWPPVRTYRQKVLATTSKDADEVENKPAVGAMFVKVSMDGAPYLRKVDLRNYSAYQEVYTSLEKMFSCFTIGRYGSQGPSGREMLSKSKLKDLLHGSEHVLAYEDKDGDWMLVGDVPWEMFIETCKRMRIMKSIDAIGLAPRTPEKAGSVNS